MTGSRLRSRRLGAILATAVFTIALVPGLATAADSRSLWIASPPLFDANGIPVNAGVVGKLDPKPVTRPATDAPLNATVFLVQILSTDNQNLSHTVLTVNAGSATGLTLEEIYDPAGGTDADPTFCSTSGNTVTCSYGSLTPSDPDRTIAVVVDVSSSFIVATQATPLFSAAVTTNNENGSNRQTFTADSGTFKVGATSPDGLNTFVPPGQTKQLFTAAVGDTNKLQTTINFTSSGGDTVAIFESTNDSTAAFYRCPTGLSCQPEYSEVITATGSFGGPSFFSWALTAKVPKTYTLTQGFVAHFLDKALNPNWTLLFKNKSSFCGTDAASKIASQGGCIVDGSLTLSKPVGGFSTLTVTVLMDHQGGLKY